MKITLLGTGSPLHPHRFQSAVLVETGESKLLFDAGRGAVHQMYQAGVALNRINPVFITHHHFDHINDLFDVMISTAMNDRTHTLDIYGPEGTRKIVFALLEQVYAGDIRFRIEEAKEMRKAGGDWKERPEAITRVAVRDIGAGLVAETEEWKVFADEVRHGDFAHVPDFEWPCLGYRVEAEGKIVAISGDTVPCDGIVRLARDADLLVQCCHLPKSAVNSPITRHLTKSILPSSGQVGAIAAEARVKRMVLTHFSALVSEEKYPEMLADIRQDFQGEVLIGEDRLEIEV